MYLVAVTMLALLAYLRPSHRYWLLVAPRFEPSFVSSGEVLYPLTASFHHQLLLWQERRRRPGAQILIQRLTTWPRPLEGLRPRRRQNLVRSAVEVQVMMTMIAPAPPPLPQQPVDQEGK